MVAFTAGTEIGAAGLRAREESPSGAPPCMQPGGVAAKETSFQSEMQGLRAKWPSYLTSSGLDEDSGSGGEASDSSICGSEGCSGRVDSGPPLIGSGAATGISGPDGTRAVAMTGKTAAWLTMGARGLNSSPKTQGLTVALAIGDASRKAKTQSGPGETARETGGAQVHPDGVQVHKDRKKQPAFTSHPARDPLLETPLFAGIAPELVVPDAKRATAGNHAPLHPLNDAELVPLVGRNGEHALAADGQTRASSGMASEQAGEMTPDDGYAKERLSQGDAHPPAGGGPKLEPNLIPDSTVGPGLPVARQDDAGTPSTALGIGQSNQTQTTVPPTPEANPVPPISGQVSSKTTRTTEHVQRARGPATAGMTSVTGLAGTSDPRQPSPFLFEDSTAMREINSTVKGAACPASPSGDGSSPVVRDAFAAIDAHGDFAAPTWMHAGMHFAEAGFQDPALGWVGVRAQVDGSGIHAALVPGSPDAAQSLGGHLAGLSSYLAEHHAPVESLTVAASESGWSGGNVGPGAGQSSGQGSGGDEFHGRQTNTSSSVAPVQRSTGSQPAPSDGRSDANRTGIPPGGVYISVMA
jgi:hypothetical protein